MAAKRREIPMADIEGKSINPIPIPHSLAEVVNEALEELSPEDQDLLRARFWEMMSFTEIAAEADLKAKSAAWHRVEAALNRLKKKLAEKGVDYGEGTE